MTNPNIGLEAISDALQERRFEAARRLCLHALESAAELERNPLLWKLYEASLSQNDGQGCFFALDSVRPEGEDEALDVVLRRGECFHRFGGFEDHRVSSENKLGYSADEFIAMMREKSTLCFDEARKMAVTQDQKRRLAQSLRQAGRANEAEKYGPAAPKQKAISSPERVGAGVLQGVLTFADGAPVANANVTLGLQVSEAPPDPARYRNVMEENFQLACSPLETIGASTDANGFYRFEYAPSGCHEFLAVSLDPQAFDISLRFIQHKVNVDGHGTTILNAVVNDWQSVEPRHVENPLPSELTYDGKRYSQIAVDVLKNPFEYVFPRQALKINVEKEHLYDPGKLLLISSVNPSKSHPFQVRADSIFYFTDLSALTDRFFGLYKTDEEVSCPYFGAHLELVSEQSGYAVVDTGAASFKIALGNGTGPIPPIASVKGADNLWRGHGRFTLPNDVSVLNRHTEIIEQGPLLLVVDIRFELSNQTEYALELTFHRDEPYVLIHEVSPPLDGATFDFSFSEFLGGRGYMHWKTDKQGLHWSDIKAEDQLLARLEETVPWWCPPEGFGYAMSHSGIEQQDFIGVFTIRRGEWIDREFAKIASGPGDDNREIDWPQPEMVGSTISMITAHSTPDDLFYRFKMFDGERYWGLLVSTVADNDCYYKKISEAQHKNSSPRLQDFKTWRLDFQNATPRPNLLVDRDNLPNLRRRKTHPHFKPIYDGITGLRPNGGGQHNPNASGGFRALIEGDATLAWRKKRELVDLAQPHSLSILLGRDYGDDYSPVGSRPVAPWAEDFDLIAATGVFTPDEERIARAHLMLLGHMYMETDFTNWKFNGRNINFEADRADTVGIVGLCFRDNPDSRKFIDHAETQVKSMIDIYCTPGSGRWYENVACYYLHSLKCWCGLALHMARHGLLDPASIHKMKDFLSWGINVITPPAPASYDFMRDGGDDAAYRSEHLARRISPIGDHAGLGSWIPEYYPLMAKYFQKSDPEFADRLSWAYHSSSANGVYFGNPMLFYSLADESDVEPPKSAPVLPSRRLEGFGATFRGHFGVPDEFFMLLNQGPGGYRYHRTQGSIILFADGKPLIYDGGEAGEAWRHTTLSFYDTHTALSPGHVERFSSLGELDFVQGVHPVALKPGEPDFLCNLCRHDLIPLAFERFHEPRPANSRSVVWVKDEYVVLHDELDLGSDIPTHWHLQAVAHDETGSLADGYVFRGRFGTDFQLLLPGVWAASSSIVSVPFIEPHLPPEKSFAMRHLQIDGHAGIDNYTAVIRPLTAGKSPLIAETIKQNERTVGVHVTGDGIDDKLFFAHKGLSFKGDGIDFEGRYAQVLTRSESTTLILIDGSSLKLQGHLLTSDGSVCSLEI